MKDGRRVTVKKRKTTEKEIAPRKNDLLSLYNLKLFYPDITGIITPEVVSLIELKALLGNVYFE